MTACGFSIHRAHDELAPYGKTIGIPFLLLGITLAIAGVGWLNRRVWGWRLAVAILATQALEDLFNVYFGRLVEGGIGIAIAGALLLYLLRADVKSVFTAGATDH